MQALFDLEEFTDLAAAKACLGMFRVDDESEFYWFFATSFDEAKALFRSYLQKTGYYMSDEEAEGLLVTEEPLGKMLKMVDDTPVEPPVAVEVVTGVETLGETPVAAKPAIKWIEKSVGKWVEEASGPGFWGSTALLENCA